MVVVIADACFLNFSYQNEIFTHRGYVTFGSYCQNLFTEKKGIPLNRRINNFF